MKNKKDYKNLFNFKFKKQNSLTNKSLLVINTGTLKKKFIFQKLKKIGIQIICLNKEKNWAIPYVDHWIIADTYNHSEAIQAIEKFLYNNPKIKINGAVTFWEDDVLLTSKITDKFNLIGIPFNIASKARNKFCFRKFCREQNIPSPNHQLIRNASDLKYVVRNFSFPLVLKPSYGSESLFVTKVDTKEELIDAYNNTKKNISTNVESSLNDGMEIFVEEFIDGDEVDIDILLQNGKVKFYSISDNFDKIKGNFFVDKGQAIPSSLPQKNQKELLDLVEETLEKLGIQNGCIHFEAKYTKKGPMPIEVNLRMGGDYVYSYVKGAWGVDLIENLVKIAFGQYFKIEKPETPFKYIIGWDLYPEDSGILVQLDIDEKIRHKKYLQELHIHKKIGDPVLVQPDGYEYLGWLTVSGENSLDAQDNLKDALDYIKYRVIKFDSSSSIGKTSRKGRNGYAAIDKEKLFRAAKLESIRKITPKDLKNLHIGIACNIYEDNNSNEVEKDLMSVGVNIQNALLKKGYKVTFFDFNNLSKVFNDLKKSDVDLVFNVCERINDSSLLEPHSASILDTLQIPYTGSNPFTLALCIDKIRVKKLLAYHEIPTPKWDYIYTMDEEVNEDLKFPLIVKPSNTDNSIGITNESVVTNKQELKRQLEKVVLGLKRPALIEEYIEGDEYDVSIIGNDDENDIRILPHSRSFFGNMPKGYWHIYPFDAKWKENGIYDKIQVQRPPKGISKRLESLISEIALDTYNILDCHDYGRVEIRVDRDGNPYVLELNPNPSINVGDCVPAAAKLIGLNYENFIEEIIKMAIRRYKNKPPYYHLQANII